MKQTITEIKSPSVGRTISALLLVLFSMEMLIMYLFTYLVPIRDPYVEIYADSALLTLAFAPVLYRYIFKPFQQAATLHRSLTVNLMAHLVDGVVIFDEELTIHSCNAAAGLMFGYHADEFAGGDARLLLGDGLPVACAEPPRSGEGESLREVTGRRRDGSPVPVELSLSRVQLAGSRMWLGIIRDMSARKEHDERMKQALSLLSATLEATADGIMVRDLRGKTTIYNRRFADMWSIPHELMASADNRGLREYVLEQLKEPRKFLAVTERQYLAPEEETHEILHFHDGRVFERFSAPQVIDRKVVGQVISYRNVTVQKNLEHQLRHAQKMEALGTLAGGVAHDFNNILTVIMGFCNLTSAQMEKGSPVMHYLDQIMAASDRALNLTNSLLAYSRKQPMNIAPLELTATLQKTEKFLGRLIGEDIELVNRLSQEKMMVMADRGQLEQVIMNLAANARDAMSRKGALIIGTGRIEIDDEFIALHGFGNRGSYALLTVSDTGVGMDEKTREKIFEPFFTTKEVGQGTGLGLSIVYGIVKQHGGFINVYSEPGKGTTFNIYLPLVEDCEQTVKKPQQQSPGGHETLLVAEDDAAVRELLKSVLEGSGYRVLLAGNGEEAVQKFREHRDEVALLLLDVVMPGKNGREALDEIHALKPRMKALFISGYTADVVDRNGLLEAGVELVMKPLLPAVLLTRVRALIDGNPSTAKGISRT